MKKIIFRLLLLSILLSGFYTVWKLYPERVVEAFSRYSGAIGSREDNSVTGTGTIEVREVDIASKLSGYISELTVSEGDRVKQDMLVAVIDRPDLQAQLSRDAAAVSAAEFQLKDMQKGARKEELDEIDAVIASAQATFSKAKKDYIRNKSLFDAKVIAPQQFDDVKTNLDISKNKLTEASERKKLLLAGVRPDKIEAQRREVERLKAAMRMTEAAISDTRIISPVSGLVLSKNFEKGELASPSSNIVTIGKMDECWVKLYIPSNLLGRIDIGQKASVKVDSFPEKEFVGIVREIATEAEFTPRQSLSKEERANLVFAVKVYLDNSSGSLKPGMPADVIFK